MLLSILPFIFKKLYSSILLILSLSSNSWPFLFQGHVDVLEFLASQFLVLPLFPNVVIPYRWVNNVLSF